MISRNGRLPLSEKLNIINECESESGYIVSLQHKICPQAVSYILKNKSRYLQAREDGRSLKLKSIKNWMNICQLDEKVSEFILAANKKGKNLNSEMIQEYANKVAEEASYENFKGSNGWLRRYFDREKIKYKKYSGEEGLIDRSVTDDWFSKIPVFKQKYQHHDILNADETALFYKCQPDHSFFHPEGDTKFLKQHKDRITIFFCVSSTGGKFIPMVIGKSARPNCFKNQGEIIKQIIYRSNKNGWMTKEIFGDWIKQLDEYYGNINKKAVLLIDNFADHQFTEELKNMSIEFLPPKTTSLTQPLDGGIIYSFKSKYRKICVQEAISQIENIDYYKNFTLLDSIEKIVEAYGQVSTETIVNCWRRCGFEA